MPALRFLCIAACGAVPFKRASSHLSGPAQPVAYNVSQLFQGDYGRAGLAHITVAGARHHGMKGVEVWLQTFAPGVGTPVHRHDCEEVFVIQRGAGSLRYRTAGGSVAELPFAANDTLVVPPNLVHQFVNSQLQGDLQALVVFDSPPIRIHTYANWSSAEAVLQRPYFWDKECPLTLPAALRRLQQRPGAAAVHAESRSGEL
ncbi:hypothetical protein ABPG75_012382 [Micractinium tetrahymenae]